MQKVRSEIIDLLNIDMQEDCPAKSAPRTAKFKTLKLYKTLQYITANSLSVLSLHSMVSTSMEKLQISNGSCSISDLSEINEKNELQEENSTYNRRLTESHGFSEQLKEENDTFQNNEYIDFFSDSEKTSNVLVNSESEKTKSINLQKARAPVSCFVIEND